MTGFFRRLIRRIVQFIRNLFGGKPTGRLELKGEAIPKPDPVVVRVAAVAATEPRQETRKMETIKVTTLQDGLITVLPVDGIGNPAPIEPGTLVATSSDETAFANGVVSNPAPDQQAYSIRVPSVGTFGQKATIHVTADADLGSGVETIEGDIEFEIVQPKAVALGLTGGAIPKP